MKLLCKFVMTNIHIKKYKAVNINKLFKNMKKFYFYYFFV